MRFNRWRWWRQHRVIWEMVKHGELYIIRSKQGWRLELPLSLRYTNKNNRYAANLGSGSDYGGSTDIFVTMKHNGKGWESHPIRLFPDSKIYQELIPSETKEIAYIFSRDLQAKPFLGTSVVCRIVNKIPGSISNSDFSVGGIIKRQGKNKFGTSIVWDTKEEIHVVKG